ncbi:MAG: alpha/beta hydrolase, partial [Mycobacterium sp.]|nr:alpha/beta hydrolase [Mycobacterium sp.]
AVSQMWHSFTLPEHDLRGRAGQITAPTIIIQGRRDPIVAAAFAEKAHDLIAGSKLVLIDSGHNPHTTDPATVAAELLTLLQPVPAVDAPRRSRD